MEAQTGSDSHPFELEASCPLYERFDKTSPFEAEVRGDEVLTCSKKQCLTCNSLKLAACKALKKYDIKKELSKDVRLKVARKHRNGELHHGLHYNFWFLFDKFRDKNFEAFSIFGECVQEGQLWNYRTA